jgi:3-phenylpropionate/trans-cinnamate dioxygenase ferredoxin reductase subunit
VMQPGHRLVIIGGGYVGLEAASAARSLGTEVVVIERETHVLARVASEPLAEFFQTFHRGRGVEIICAASVTAFEGERHGRVRGVSVASGASISCDAVLVGVGATSCDALAQNAKLQCANGVVVDSKAQTLDPRIFAIGDVTSRPLSIYDNQMFRLESVPNALEQAKQAVHAILGLPEPAPEVPWFWSDQYDLKLQIAGLPFDRDDLVIRGSAEQRRFSVFHMKADRIVSVEALNSPAEFMVGRKLIGMKCPVARDVLADAKVPMKSLASLGS